MTITTKHGKDWNLPLTILAVYSLLGLVFAFAPSAALSFQITAIAKLPVVMATSRALSSPDRVTFFWQGMLLGFPVALGAFSITAPVKLSRNSKDKSSAVLVSLAAMAFFGLMTIVLAYAFLTSKGGATTKIDRMVSSMNQGALELVVTGALIFNVTLVMAWLSFVAIPTAICKITFINGFKGEK